MDPLAILAVRRSEPPLSRGFHLWPLIVLMLILLAVAVATLGPRTVSPVASISPTPTESDVIDREPRVYAVSYRFGVFSPTNLRIHAGDTVRWKNDSPLPIRIVAQLQAGQKTPEFDSIGMVQPDGYFAYTFGVSGVFGYTNASNANESGVIIVR